MFTLLVLAAVCQVPTMQEIYDTALLAHANGLSEKELRMVMDIYDGMSKIDRAIPANKADKKNAAKDKIILAVARKYNMTIVEMGTIARYASDAEYLLDALHLRITPGEPVPPLTVGIARVGGSVCTCGAKCGFCWGVSDPMEMRHIDDMAELAKNHTSEEHTSVSTPRVKGVQRVMFFTKVTIKELIKKDDARYHNRYPWVRALVDGKTLYVESGGLRNTF